MVENGANARPSQGYAGDIDAKQAWKLLEDNDEAVLIDVRTKAEWSFVGIPDLSRLNKECVFVEWQLFPLGPRDTDFMAELAAVCEQRHVTKNAPLLFLCRSGSRSRSAAMACTEAGFQSCFNVSDGFEGDLDQLRRRNSVNGWKQSGLPWRQS
ncbi:MAG: rhodanese-like domain-containing protein [Alphaproteobacteria bacterium]|nr:MAG: rhodanese-like domain-containing protein [Alphaproteobacteria bacterium]